MKKVIPSLFTIIRVKSFGVFLVINFLITGALIASGSIGFTAGGQYDWVVSDNQISKITMHSD